ncbi:hypothetical protein CKAN_02656000 [Cinnamomum micranthum f. kanehirae]|uniref:Uncharacterized protein n=1 Tax=Cinnamomum micranthum f. kanehirae TaxID=337451 RepID=A0A3S3RB25_9MAGN|nr:hypothetical protein CKAN_02656000 [Cinnamomum micranthum f. kanehirae]
MFESIRRHLCLGSCRERINVEQHCLGKGNVNTSHVRGRTGSQRADDCLGSEVSGPYRMSPICQFSDKKSYWDVYSSKMERYVVGMEE